MIRLVFHYSWGLRKALKSRQLQEGLDQEYTLLPKRLQGVESFALVFSFRK